MLTALISGSRARWHDKDVPAGQKASSWLTKVVVMIARVCTVLSLFQAALFTACTSGSSQISHNGQINRARRRKLTKGGYSLEQLARMGWLKRVFAYYLLAVNSLYIWWVVLSLAVIVIDLNLLAPYRYLDCYLLGRFSINARISHAAKYTCFMMVVFFLSLRLALVLYRPQFHLQALDFMYRDLDNVERHNRRPDLTCHKMVESAGEHDKRVQADATKKTDEDGLELHYKRCRLLGAANSGFLAVEPAEQIGEDDDEDDSDDECMFAKTDCSMDYFVIRKLNRRPAHWYRLNVRMVVWLVAVLTCGVGWLVWWVYLMTPTIVTKRGFEFSYPNCVSYIREYANGSQARAQEFKFIYEAAIGGEDEGMHKTGGKQQEVPVMLPMEDFVSGQYHTIRMAFDYFQSLALYMDAPAILLAHMMFHVMLVKDLQVNGREILKRLVCLRKNRWHQMIKNNQSGITNEPPSESQLMLTTIRQPEIVIEGHGRKDFLRYRSNCCRRNNAPGNLSDGQNPNLFWIQPSSNYLADYTITTSETIILQTLLLDHFKCTKVYNHYTSKLSLYAVCLWFALTCTILVWLGFTGIESVEREFYIAEIVGTLLLLVHMLLMSVIRRSNREFYPLISSLMAMDDWQSVTKLRWVSILEHYQPKPMYCFTLLSAEISYFLIFRLIAWSFSALFVVVSFFYERLARMKLTS